MAIDIDVDSNNDDTIDPDNDPTTGTDDPDEDVQGDDALPGKVILVNDGDIDGDGWPDYVDGYNYSGALTVDDLCDGCEFTPLVVSAKGLDPSSVVQLSYSASDPSTDIFDLDSPTSWPSGALRIWTVDGSAARSKKNVTDGGHFIAPGTYRLDQLGLDGTTPTTFYVEALQASSSTGDNLISLSFLQNGVAVASDVIAVTTTRFELTARNFGETDFQPVSAFVASMLDVDDVAGTTDGMTNGAYQTHKINVYDPRSTGITDIQVHGSTLPLTNVGMYYETAEFFGLELGSETPLTTSHITLDGPIAQWQYNPGGKRGINHVIELNDWDEELALKIREVVDGMESTNWTAPPGDHGAFGREVHARVSPFFENEPGWLVNVTVRNGSNQIVQIGLPVAPGDNTDTTQIDFLKVKNGYLPNPDDILDHTQIDDLYDIKTPLTGNIPPDQRFRLKSVLNGWHNPQTRDIKSAMVHKRFTLAKGWHENTRYKNGLRLLSLIGIASAAHATWAFDENDPQLLKIVANAKKINNGGYKTYYGAGTKEEATAMWLAEDVRPWLKQFSPNGAEIDLGVALAVRKVLGQMQ